MGDFLLKKLEKFLICCRPIEVFEADCIQSVRAIKAHSDELHFLHSLQQKVAVWKIRKFPISAETQLSTAAACDKRRVNQP